MKRGGYSPVTRGVGSPEPSTDLHLSDDYRYDRKGPARPSQKTTDPLDHRGSIAGRRQSLPACLPLDSALEIFAFAGPRQRRKLAAACVGFNKV